MKYRARVIVAVCVLTLVSCSKNPETAKRNYLRRGNEFAAQQKYAEAIIEFRNAIQIDQRYGDARRALGDVYVQSGDLSNAATEYIRAADLLPDDAALQVTCGNLLIRVGRFDDARVRATGVLQKDPRNVDAELLLGSALAGLNDPNSAIAQIEQAIKLDPAESRAYTALGSIRLTQGQMEAAEAAFKRAIELAPTSARAQSALGFFLWSVNRVPEAEQAFKKALAEDPKSLPVNRILATLYVTTNRPDQAEPYLKTMAESGPDQQLSLAEYYISRGRSKDAMVILDPLSHDARYGDDARLLVANIDFVAGRSGEARKIVDDTLRKSPTKFDALLWKARLLMLDKQLDDALAAAKGAVKVDPQNVMGQYLVGALYAMHNDRANAIAAFAEAVHFNRRAVPAYLQLARLYQAGGDATALVGVAQDGLRAAPDNLELRSFLARGLIGTGDLDRADAIIRALLAQYPDTASVHALSGALAVSRRDTAKARQAFEAALQLNPNNLEALGDLTTLDVEAKRIADAQRLIDDRLAHAPHQAALMILAAKVSAAAGDSVSAEQRLKEAITADPGNVPAREMLGQLYIDKRRLDDAQSVLGAAAKLDPTSTSVSTLIAMILEDQNRKDEAVRQYERVLDIDPNAVLAANNLANLYSEGLGDLNVALELAQRAQKRMPSDAAINDTLGWIYFKRRLLPQAITALEVSVKNAPENPQFHYHLGMAYLGTGNTTKGREALERALKLQPDFPGADEARKALSANRG